jgi:hypothetical protein
MLIFVGDGSHSFNGWLLRSKGGRHGAAAGIAWKRLFACMKDRRGLVLVPIHQERA